MNYPQDFIKEVKACYPDSDKIQKLAEEGNIFLGRYLDDSSNEKIPIKDILKAITLGQLQTRARLEKRKRDLYYAWKLTDIAQRP